jgi:hypothetical protein
LNFFRKYMGKMVGAGAGAGTGAEVFGELEPELEPEQHKNGWLRNTGKNSANKPRAKDFLSLSCIGIIFIQITSRNILCKTKNFVNHGQYRYSWLIFFCYKPCVVNTGTFPLDLLRF